MANKSKMRSMLEQGCIAEWYTLKGFFLKLYPCFEIDKVKFSFVMKGKKGEGFDVYVDTDDFSLLCDDILSLRMATKIACDKGEYPSAWTYATGENGALSVAIGKSQKGGVVVQGRNGNTKANAFVPLTDYNELRKMAFLYNILSGKELTTRYYAELVDAFWNRPKWTDNNDKSKQSSSSNYQQSRNDSTANRQQQNRYGNKAHNNPQPNNRSGNSAAAPSQRQNSNRASAPSQQPSAPPPPPGIAEEDIPFNEMPNYGAGYGEIVL